MGQHHYKSGCTLSVAKLLDRAEAVKRESARKPSPEAFASVSHLTLIDRRTNRVISMQRTDNRELPRWRGDLEPTL